MRNFDYTTLSEALQSPEVINLLLAARELKGRQVALGSVKPDILGALVEQAKYASTKASNQIEGIVTTEVRLKALMQESTAPRNRNEEEIAGYRDVLALIHEQHDYIDIKPSVILQLHRNLLAHTSYSYGGAWKDSDGQIVARNPDGTTYVRFTPTPAMLTPGAIESLCDAYRSALQAQRYDPLLLSVLFVFDFVSIHPFNNGNGRMSRLITVLLLERCGYEAPRYISVEKLIEQSKESYYEALAASSQGWETGDNDASPFVRYMLGIVVKAYRELFDRIDGQFGTASKASSVAAAFDRRLGKVTKSDIRNECPGISDITIERELKRMLDAGEIVKVGAGRGTGYVKK